MDSAKRANLDIWYDYMKAQSSESLMNQLADDAVFYSPVVHSPQSGKAMVFAYLNAAESAFANSAFQYVDEILSADGRKAVLEFTCEIDDIHINGIDIIQWNEAGKIEKFKVLIRPMKAMNKIWEKMAAILEANKG